MILKSFNLFKVLVLRVLATILIAKLLVHQVAFGALNAPVFYEGGESIDTFFRAFRQLDVGSLERYQNRNLSWDRDGLSKSLVAVFSGNRYFGNRQIDTTNPEQAILKYLVLGYDNWNNDEASKIEAYQYFSKAIQLADSEGFKEGLKFSLISMLNLLQLQVFMGEDKFIPYLDHYREVKSDFTDELIIALFEMALSAKENADLVSEAKTAKALLTFEELFSKVPDESLWKSKYYKEIGGQAKLKEDYKGAIHYYHRALKLIDKKYQKEDYKSAVWQLSHLFLLQKNTDSALFYLKKSMALAKNHRDYLYDERLASWIYKAQGKYDSAYYYLNRSILSEFRWDAKRNSMQSGLLAIENETEKLKLDKLQLDNRRKTNQTYLILALSLFLLGTVTSIFLQRDATKKRQLAEQEALLKQQRVDGLLKRQELIGIDAMIEGQEKERERVAGELHDDLGSLMATIKLHFDASRAAKNDPTLQNARKLLEKAYQKIRGIAHTKNSGVMSDRGLLQAINQMADTINRTKAITINVYDFGLGERMENSVELAIFRMIQELVANTVKHAHATEVNIQLTQHEDSLNILVEDNGKGFDRTKINSNGSSTMGLTTIEKRVEHLEGNFMVDSVVGSGTSIIIDIPV